MGSARVGYPTHRAGGMLHQSGLGDYEGTFPLGLQLVLFLVRQA